VIGGDDLLVRDRQVDAAAVEFTLLAQLADLTQQLQRLRRVAGVEILLHTRVVQLGPGLHQRAFTDDARTFAGRVDGDRPQQGRTDLVSQ
jgi:hypothetical protein